MTTLEFGHRCTYGYTLFLKDCIVKSLEFYLCIREIYFAEVENTVKKSVVKITFIVPVEDMSAESFRLFLTL